MQSSKPAYTTAHIIQYGILAAFTTLDGQPWPSGDYEVTAEEIMRVYGDTYEHLDIEPDPDPPSSSASSSAGN